MAYYTCLLLDADNTLLDFDAAERKALADTLIHYDLPTTNRRSTPITRSTAACGTAWPKASSTKTGCLPSVSASTSRRWACRITAKAVK